MDSDDSHAAMLRVKLEATNVITAMRQNAKWAPSPGSRPSAELSETAQELMQGVQALRWGGVLTEDTQSLDLLKPFLRIIVTDAASGPITAAALLSVKRLLLEDALGTLGAPGIAAAMQETVAALTFCKFEATHDTYDQMVLCNILQTLCAALACPSGCYLTDGDVVNMFEAAYRIGFDMQIVPYLSEMVIDMVKDSLHAIVDQVFTSLRRNPMPDDTHTNGTAAPAGRESADLTSTGAAAGADGSAPTGPAAPKKAAANGVAPPGHGDACALHILSFLIGLVKMDTMREVGLELIAHAIQAAGPALQAHPALLRVVQIDLMGAVLSIFKTPANSVEPNKVGASVISQMTQVMLTVYQCLRRTCVLQVELYMQTVLLPLVAGSLLQGPRGHTPSALVEAGIESVLDFCYLPGFLREAYAHLDCRTETSNLFQDLCRQLARRATPRGGGPQAGLTGVNIIALQGLAAVQTVLAEGGSKPTSIAQPPRQLFNSKERVDLWGAILRGRDPDCSGVLLQQNGASKDESDEARAAWDALGAVRQLQYEKTLKNKIVDAVEMLNNDYKKGLQFMQVNKLLPDPMTPESVAGLLRYAPGVDKQLIGNYMGKGDAFNKEVLAEYTRSFGLESLDFDVAFRIFADTFKQPPETQQVMRFTHSFVASFLAAHNNNYRGIRSYKCLDDFMTVSLWHNSTWYNVNPKVPKLRTLHDFVKTMSDSITEEDNPEEAVFQEMYESVCESAFPQGNNKTWQIDMPTARLAQIANRAKLERGQVPPPSPFLSALDRDMFLSTWASTVRAAAAVLEQAQPDDSATIADGMRCLHLVAHVAKDNHVEDVLDSLLLTLAKFTQPLDAGAGYPGNVVAFGRDRLAQEAMYTLFSIVADYGDMLRGGWAQVMACVLRLHKVHLVDSSIFLEDAATEEGGTKLQRSAPATAESSGNLFGYLFSSASAADAELNPMEQAAEADARRCVVDCRLGAMFEDSKFLGPESLLELVRAVMEAPGALDPAAEVPLDVESAEACLELLIKLCIRNRDRIQLLLPLVRSHLKAVVAYPSDATLGLTQRAVSGVIRICTRLLAYRADVSEDLLDTLRILTALDFSPTATPCLYPVAPQLAKGLATLVFSSAAHVPSESGWKLIWGLAKQACEHPAAMAPVYAALELVCRNGAHINTINYMHTVEAISAYVKGGSEMLHPDRHTIGGNYPAPYEARLLGDALDLLEGIVQWLVKLREDLIAEGQLPEHPEPDMHTHRGYAKLAGFWNHLLKAIVSGCHDWHPEVRDHAMIVLHKSLVTAGESLHLSADTWGITWSDHVLPMVQRLSSSASDGSSAGGAAKAAHETAHSVSISMAINTVSKTYLAHISDLMQLRDWRGLWLATLQALAQCDSAGTQDVHQAVVGAMSSLLRAMHQRGLLSQQQADADNQHVWQRSWAIAGKVSPDQLTPEICLT